MTRSLTLRRSRPAAPVPTPKQAETDAALIAEQEADRHRGTLEALHEEERAIGIRYQHAVRVGAERVMVEDSSAPGGYRLGQTGHELAAHLDQRLESIRNEISRLEAQAR